MSIKAELHGGTDPIHSQPYAINKMRPTNQPTQMPSTSPGVPTLMDDPKANW